jgi:predicted N-acetyltransferase YhbS
LVQNHRRSDRSEPVRDADENLVGEGGMGLTIRRARPEDATACGPICYQAFKEIAEAHNFTPDIPSQEVATHVISTLIANNSFYGVVAELDGRIVGSNFLDERANSISGIGPVTVDPAVQNQQVGRRLMNAVLRRSAEVGFAGVRLVQAGYHCRSLSLYSKLGFEIREHLSCLQGSALGLDLPGYAVRSAIESDVAACNGLCVRVHGHDRAGETEAAVWLGEAMVVERNGRITGYATQIGFFGHAVAETTDDLKGLIGAAKAFMGPGILVPSRNGELLRWCLGQGLRITQPLTLMTMGLYNEPAGAFLPSISY